MSEFLRNSTIVLVHAAWADGSCWGNIILPLERHGLHVMCAPIPLTSLSDDVTALNRALERTTGPVVLVGTRLFWRRNRRSSGGPSQVSGLYRGACARRGRDRVQGVLSRPPTSGSAEVGP
jgi:hypothetical protein